MTTADAAPGELAPGASPVKMSARYFVTASVTAEGVRWDG